MSTLNLLAPAPGAAFETRSGNSYTANSTGVIAVNLATGLNDIGDLIAAGCAPIGSFSIYPEALPWVHGQFYVGGTGTPEAVLTVSGTLYAFPIFVPNAVTLDSINYSVTTGQTGGKVRGALFQDNGAGYPGAIVVGSDTGDLTATGTAVETKSGLALALPPGWYWLGTIATASSTMPSVIGAKTLYTNGLPKLLGFDTAAHALATSGEAPTGLAITGQTYPATDMKTSFATFPASAALTLNADTPVAALGV